MIKGTGRCKYPIDLKMQVSQQQAQPTPCDLKARGLAGSEIKLRLAGYPKETSASF
jgi:hypothetical protein